MAYLTLKRGLGPGPTVFAGLLVSIAVYATGYSLELASSQLESMLLSIRLEYLGVVNLPALWLLQALYYSKAEKWLQPRRFAGLWLIPVVVLAAVLTNDAFHLHYTRAWVDTSGAFPILAVERGPVYWLHIVYSFASFIVGALILVRQYLIPHTLFHRQVSMMLLASLLTIGITILHVAGITLLPGLDINPFAMIVSAWIMGWCAFRYQLVDLTPVARSLLFEHLIDAVIVLDSQHRVLDYNPSANRIFAFPPHAVGAKLEKLVPEAGAAILMHLGPQASSQERTVQAQGERIFEVDVAGLTEKNSTSAGYVIIFHEITQRKAAQQALETANAGLEAHIRHLKEAAEARGSSPERYRLLTENSNDVIWTRDLQGRITFISPSVEHLRGYTPEEVMQQTLEERVCAHSLPIVRESIQRAFIMVHSGLPQHPEYYEVEQPCKDGGTVWTEVTTRLMFDEAGCPVGFVGTSRDIRERKRIKDQLQQTLDELTTFNRAMVGRETRMLELKQEVNELLARLNQSPKYPIP
jgi:PAS domain S-box-containing protein